MEIIVISIAQYKEKDAVISAITNDKLITFYAKGIMNPNNKNSFLNCILTKANITLVEGKIKYPILETAELIFSPMKPENGYYYLTSIMLLDEAILHMVEPQERFLSYKYLNNAIMSLKNGENPLLVSLFFLLKLLPITGFEIEVNKCLICGSKKGIVDFSFEEGGFLCKDCASEERKYSKNQLLLLRLNILNDEPTVLDGATDDEIKTLLFDTNIFVTDGIGYHLKQLDMLLK